MTHPSSSTRLTGYLSATIVNNGSIHSNTVAVEHTPQRLHITAPLNSLSTLTITINGHGNSGTDIAVGPGLSAQIVMSRQGSPDHHAARGHVTFTWNPQNETLLGTFACEMDALPTLPRLRLADGFFDYPVGAAKQGPEE